MQMEINSAEPKKSMNAKTVVDVHIEMNAARKKREIGQFR